MAFLTSMNGNHHADVFAKPAIRYWPSGHPAPGNRRKDAVLWKYIRGVPYVATPVIDHGILYMVKDGGIVTKLDVATGRLLQEERVPGLGNYFSSPVAGDGKIYFASEPGTVSVLASRQDWNVISSHEFHERIYATPALARGCVYIRTEQALYCFEVGRLLRRQSVTDELTRL